MDTADWNSQILSLVANRDKILRYSFLIQFVAAIPFLWFATVTGKQNARLLLKGSGTTGTVVSVVPVQFNTGSGSSSRTSYEAVVSFSAAGDQFHFQEWKGTRVAPAVGTRVAVIYDSSDPEIAMVDRGYWNFLPWAPCAAIGSFLLLVSLKGLLILLLRR
jgi:hypothetical protein